jgi:hypothetical protein
LFFFVTLLRELASRQVRKKAFPSYANIVLNIRFTFDEKDINVYDYDGELTAFAISKEVERWYLLSEGLYTVP